MKDKEKTKDQLIWELKKLRQQVLRDNEIKDREVAHLNRVLDVVNSTLDLELVVEKVREALQAIFSFNQVSIYLFNAEKNVLELKYWYGDGASEALQTKFENNPLSLEWEDVYFIKAFLDIEPLYVSPITPELLELYSDRDSEMFEWNPHKAIAIIPLQVQEKVIGVINFADTKTPFDLDKEDCDRIQRYVGQIAATINNAYLVRKTQFALKEAKSKEREIAHINEIIQTANSTLDFDEVFSVVLGGLKDIFEFDAVGIQLVNEKRDSLNIYKVYGEHIHAKYVQQWQDIQVSTVKNDSVSSSVFSIGKPAYFPKITQDMPFTSTDWKIFKVLSFVSYLAYPLVVQGEVIGVISFFGANEHNELKESELSKIQRYVTSISTTINNAKNYQQLKYPDDVFSSLFESNITKLKK